MMSDRRQMTLSEWSEESHKPVDESDDIVCPTCGKNDFSSEHGLKIHHTTVHDDRSLTLDDRVEFVCDRCGDTKQLVPEEAERRRFCSDECKNKWQSEAYSGEGSPSWDGGKVTISCDYCGEKEKRFPSQVNDINYCSDSCEANWKSENQSGESHPNYNKLTVACDWCNEELNRIQHRVENYENQFCDKHCKGKYYSANPTELHEKDSVTVHCDSCGDSIEVIPSRVTRSDYHFCDKECKGEWWSKNVAGEDHPNWKGGYEPYYGPNWEAKRESTRKRDDCRCVLCGLSEDASRLIHQRDLSVHHVNRLNDFDNPAEANKLGNLLTVCITCHQRVFE